MSNLSPLHARQRQKVADNPGTKERDCNVHNSDLAEAFDHQACQSVSQSGICWLEHLVLLEHWRNPLGNFLNSPRNIN